VNEGGKDDDDNDEVTGTPLHRLTSFDVWALGISIVIGGQYYKWNSGLEAGFGSYAIGTGLMAILYACICICNAELSSAVPFAGKQQRN
jgi:amino acid transporter